MSGIGPGESIAQYIYIYIYSPSPVKVLDYEWLGSRDSLFCTLSRADFCVGSEMSKHCHTGNSAFPGEVQNRPNLQSKSRRSFPRLRSFFELSCCFGPCVELALQGYGHVHFARTATFLKKGFLPRVLVFAVTSNQIHVPSPTYLNSLPCCMKSA